MSDVFAISLTGSSRTDGAAGAREAAERRARQVRLYDLPPGTQEGLLQQELEKIVPVKRLEVHAATHDALVELESQHVSRSSVASNT